MLERRHERLLPARQFAWRVAGFAGAAGVLILFALGIGVAGYHWIAGFSPIDSLLNASMILGAWASRRTARQGGQALCVGVCSLQRPRLHHGDAVIFTPLFHRLLIAFMSMNEQVTRPIAAWLLASHVCVVTE